MYSFCVEIESGTGVNTGSGGTSDLSTGAIIGIVLGAAALLLAIILIGGFICFANMRSQNKNDMVMT